MTQFTNVTNLDYKRADKMLYITHKGTTQTDSISTEGLGIALQAIKAGSEWNFTIDLGPVDGGTKGFTEVRTRNSQATLDFTAFNHPGIQQPTLNFIGIQDIRDGYSTTLPDMTIGFEKSGISIQTDTLSGNDMITIRKAHHL
ncbi:MAG: hypothetical protein AAF985_00405 [Bacteroidota bacterium]